MQLVNRARALMRIETGLAALVILAAALVVYLYLERNRVRDEVLDLNNQVILAESDTAGLFEEADIRSADLDKKREEQAAQILELEQQAAEALPADFPTLQLALDLSGQITAFVAENDLKLSSFETSREPVLVSETEFPAVTYTLSARGSTEGLVGLLEVIERIATAKFNELIVSRDADEGDGWIMRLDVAVVYTAEG